MKAKLTNRCVEAWCPSCEFITWEGDDNRCDECDTELEPVSYCMGDCWETMKEDVDYIFCAWMDAVGAGEWDGIAIYGGGMGWERRASHTGRLEVMSSEVIEALTGNYDLIIEFTFDEDAKTFTAVRRSHDEMGAYFEVRRWEEGDDE